MKHDLKIDWASHEAGKHAVMSWHYSKKMPLPPLNIIGAWEGNRYIGAIIFGRGANSNIGKEYGLDMTTCCELVRVALNHHKTPVSKIIKVALLFLKKHNEKIRLVVSYADTTQGHHGGIYQAGNWVYVGRGMQSTEWFHRGRWVHNHCLTGSIHGKRLSIPPGTKKRTKPGKHKYLMPLDDEIKKQILPLAKPYPKRTNATSAPEASSDAADIQSAEGGAAPTPALE